MKKIILFIFISLLLILFLLESDRNRYNTESFYNFYIKQFPNSLYYGIYNSTFKIFYNKCN